MALPALADHSWVLPALPPHEAYESTGTEPLRRVQVPSPIYRSYSGLLASGGRVAYFGGGHSTHPGNDVDLFDPTVPAWKVIAPPDVPPFPSDAWTAIAMSGGFTTATAPSGNPYTQHTYQPGGWDPQRRIFWMQLGSGGVAGSGGVTHGATWTYDPATGIWTKLGVGPYWNFREGVAWFDAQRDRFMAVLLGPFGNWTRGVWAFNPTAKTWSQLSAKALGGYAWGAYGADAGDLLLVVAPFDWSRVDVWRYVPPETWIPLAPPPGVPLVGGQFAYDATSHVWIVFGPPRQASGAVIWSFDPATGQWANLGPGAGAPAFINFDWGESSFVYVKESNVFVALEPLTYYCATPGPGGSCGGPTRTWLYRYRRASAPAPSPSPAPAPPPQEGPMAQNVTVTPVTESRLFPQGTAVAKYHFALVDVAGTEAQFQDFLMLPPSVTFPAVAPGTYTVRALTQDAAGLALASAVSTPISVGADVTLVVVSGLTVQVVRV